MDSNTILTAADLCKQSYNKSLSLKPDWAKLGEERIVNLYRLTSQIKAFVITEPATKPPGCAYVVFRGTIPTMVGNWLFANLQLFKTKYQGCPLDGTVHMGFYRAFHWLWNGGREPITDAPHKEGRWRVFWKRQAIFAVLFLTCGFLLPLICAMAIETPFFPVWKYVVPLWAALILVELGIMEWLFMWWKPKVTGQPLNDLAGRLGGYSDVVFTGHSLGGAMATIAFADYQNNSPNKNGRLITFAAPHVGDVTCMERFETNAAHAGRYLHVINVGDPVPLSPGTLEQARDLPNEAGWMRPVMIWVGQLRRLWAHLYDQEPPGAWQRNTHLLEVGELPLSFQNHAMPKYESLANAKLAPPVQ